MESGDVAAVRSWILHHDAAEGEGGTHRAGAAHIEPINMSVLTRDFPLHQLQGMYAVDELDDSALAIGSVNTTFFRFSSNPPVHVGMNLDQAGVGNSLLNSLTGHSTPFPAGTPTLFAPKSAAALMVGGGGATRAAVYAMHEKIGVETILLLNRDPQETAAIVAQFEKWDLRPVESVEHAEQLLKDLAAEGKTLCIGTGAIPAIDPVTDGEKLVYAAAKVLFNGKYEKQTGGDVEGHLKHPEKPVFLDMVYKVSLAKLVLSPPSLTLALIPLHSPA